MYYGSLSHEEKKKIINRTYYYLYLIHKKYDRLQINPEVTKKLFYYMCRLFHPDSTVHKRYFETMIWSRPHKMHLAHFLLEEGYTWRDMQKIIQTSPTRVREFLKKNPNHTLETPTILYDPMEQEVILELSHHVNNYIEECKKKGYNVI
jgi:hypothetical protein